MICIGTSNPLSSVPAFVIPIYEKNKTHYIMVMSSNNEVHFRQILIDPNRLETSYQVIKMENQNNNKSDIKFTNERIIIGDEVNMLYAFADVNKNVVIGSKEELSFFFKIKMEEIRLHKGLYCEICDFINDYERKLLFITQWLKTNPIQSIKAWLEDEMIETREKIKHSNRVNKSMDINVRRFVKMGTGRRVNAVARVELIHGSGKITVNNKTLEQYFNYETLRREIKSPLVLTKTDDKFDVIVRVVGGGKTSQAGAIRDGISKALLGVDSDAYRAILKASGFLTVDSRRSTRTKTKLKKPSKSPLTGKRHIVHT